MGLFFSKAALVTFGGAYAVLPYVSQQAVETFNWLSASQMLDGLAFAETTPGPLIIVLEFVGFLGGWNHPDGLSPLVAGTLGAVLTVWCTFAPCFLWIFLGAPYVEGLRARQSLSNALEAVSAAAVGLMLNLAVWSCRSVLVNPSGGVDWAGVGIALLAVWGIQRWKLGVFPLVVASGVLGILLRWLAWV
jgi:chromate transporter